MFLLLYTQSALFFKVIESTGLALDEAEKELDCDEWPQAIEDDHRYFKPFICIIAKLINAIRLRAMMIQVYADQDHVEAMPSFENLESLMCSQMVIVSNTYILQPLIPLIYIGY
jgi:hypothetical protein